MKISPLLLTAAASAMILGSCSKSGSGGSSNSSSTLQFQLKAANPLVVVNKTDAPGSIQWTSGTASAAQVKLEAKQGLTQKEFSNSQLQQIDLFASVAVGLG